MTAVEMHIRNTHTTNLLHTNKKHVNITFNKEEESILELGLNYAFEKPVKYFLQDLIIEHGTHKPPTFYNEKLAYTDVLRAPEVFDVFPIPQHTHPLSPSCGRLRLWHCFFWMESVSYCSRQAQDDRSCFIL
jgi:hypothetical protein